MVDPRGIPGPLGTVAGWNQNARSVKPTWWWRLICLVQLRWIHLDPWGDGYFYTPVNYANHGQNHHFDGIYQERWGFSMATTVYWRVFEILDQYFYQSIYLGEKSLPGQAYLLGCGCMNLSTTFCRCCCWRFETAASTIFSMRLRAVDLWRISWAAWVYELSGLHWWRCCFLWLKEWQEGNKIWNMTLRQQGWLRCRLAWFEDCWRAMCLVWWRVPH